MGLIKKILLLSWLLTPNLSRGQWAVPFVTGSGAGHGSGTYHETLFGNLQADTFSIIGFQQLGSGSNIGFEYFQDHFSSNQGQFLGSQILYPFGGSETPNRPRQRIARYPNGYLLNHTFWLRHDSVYYLKDESGSLQRIDSAKYIPAFTTQRVDSTNSYLISDSLGNLTLKNWFNGDTLQSIGANFILQSYQGSLDLSKWELREYHTDGAVLYLEYGQPRRYLDYGIDVLKFDLNSGAYMGHLHFFNRRFSTSKGQGYKIVVEDSVVMPSQAGDPYVSYNRIIDGAGLQIGSFTYSAELYQGNVYNQPYFYINDSLIVISTPISDTRVASGYNKGSHLRVYEINGTLISHAKLFSGHIGGNFIIANVLDVSDRFIFFNTWVEEGINDQNLLVSMPLNLQLESSYITLGLENQSEIQSFDINIYPNPSSGHFIVDSSFDYDRIILTSLDARIRTFLEYNKDHRYSTLALTPGIYTVEIYANGRRIHSSKLLK
jgi:hypothetical protein